MMYSMLRFGYPKWSVIPSDERELWFRQFAVVTLHIFLSFYIFLNIFTY